MLGDVLLLPLLVLVMEEEKEEGLMALVAGMVVDDSSTAVAVAVVEGRGCSGMDDSDRRWSSGMGAKWVWSELVM